MKSSAKKIELASVDDLFSTEESRQDEQLERIQEIPLLSARKTLSLLRRSFEAEDGIPRASSMTIRSRDSSAAVTVNVL